MTVQSIEAAIQDKIDIYDALLHKWQKTINLVSNSTLSNSKQRHFEDSLQCLPMIPNNTKTLYDIGSGAGFPGLVLAMARPDIQVHLIESNTKKTNFMKTVIRDTGIENAQVHTSRIEDMAKTLPAPDVITARALATLLDLFTLTAPWAAANKDLRYVLLKGQTARSEIAQALDAFSFAHYAAPSLTEPDAQILRIQNVTPQA